MNVNEDAVVVIAAAVVVAGDADDGGLLFELIACYLYLLCCYVE